MVDYSTISFGCKSELFLSIGLRLLFYFVNKKWKKDYYDLK